MGFLTLLNQSLNQLQADLPPDDFVRVHRSAIINLNYLKEIKKLHMGSYHARMKDKRKTEVPVSCNSRVKLRLG
ncbi:LytTR family transcriptional regulator [candidate division KSB1 bacterium]|nr:LytTR family transcriptional regulator [candidate division KSB1 bacterium]